MSPREQLLSEIKKGVKLKPVKKDEEPKAPSHQDALRKALEDRLKAFAQDDDEDDQASDDDEDDKWAD